MDTTALRILVPVADVRGEPDDEAELVTQALRGERVLVLEDGQDGWTRVVLPGQTSTLEERGYPGWVRSADIAATVDADGDDGSEADVRADAAPPTAEDFLAAVRAYGGVPYLWGGLTREGIDCSGLVHVALREIGIRVPRDAHDQESAIPAVAVEDVRPGDLYFFAEGGAPIHHVGVVAEPGVMIHAPEVGAVVIEEDLDEERRATLVAAARIFT